ncbi:hypothetical protein [Phyllobacterium chamaecytisi]|uniref:hypothetical protein n=1 Tax=Phyllobacterium chamaecytisi TaxID=2876082 RepID=UPI001CCEA841|nr:hypothetical protein [Phyllobacterium sp. KW56]MBZ9600724.1 hypothetical protein [Phyllobacterium sp. KW56]
MKHSRSSAEWEIRDALVTYCRASMPTGRIVHELNTSGQGSCRADLAVIEPDYLTLFEIKSQKDTLKRLPEQSKAFEACSHEFIICAHTKHFIFEETEHYTCPVKRLNADGFAWRDDHVWEYPEPPKYTGLGDFRWKLRRNDQWKKGRPFEPRALSMLSMLWQEELVNICHAHRIAVTTRATIPVCIKEITWHMTGQEICKAVCRALRARTFTEADAPMMVAA